MSGPPYKWQWVDSVNINRDEQNNETVVDITWRSKDQSDSKPTSPVGEVEESCGDCIVWLGAIREVNGFGIRSSADAAYLGIPDVEDGGTATVTLNGTEGDIVFEFADSYTEDQWLDEACGSTDRGCGTGTLASIDSIGIADVTNSDSKQYSFVVTNGGTAGNITISAGGTNVDSQDFTDSFNAGETKEYTGSYSIAQPGGQAVLNVDANGDVGDDSASATAVRPAPDIQFRSVEGPSRLCPGEEASTDVVVSNTGGQGQLDFTLEGRGFGNINETRTINANGIETFSTTVQMPNTDITSADITATALDQTITSTVSVSRIPAGASLSITESQSYNEPGQPVRSQIEGSVESCSQSGTLSLDGFFNSEKTDTVSPGQPLVLEHEDKMPAKSINYNVEFETLNQSDTASFNTKPENAILIDTEQGISVHSPPQPININLLVIAEDIEGAGQDASSQDINELTSGVIPRMMAASPRNQVRVLRAELSDREFKNILATGIKYVSGVSTNRRFALGVNGKFSEKTDRFTYQTLPVFNNTLSSGEDSNLG